MHAPANPLTGVGPDTAELLIESTGLQPPSIHELGGNQEDGNPLPEIPLFGVSNPCQVDVSGRERELPEAGDGDPSTLSQLGGQVLAEGVPHSIQRLIVDVLELHAVQTELGKMGTYGLLLFAATSPITLCEQAEILDILVSRVAIPLFLKLRFRQFY